jgi:short subunit dehydrogenase-like uncharacterized protein
MIYGANGYTGRLMAESAVEQGLTPILAGRNESAVRQLAESLSLQWRIFDLDDGQATADAIRGCRAVLHCAGPFSVTSQPMIAACLAEGVHYLDITGEISVFANAHRQADEASRHDVLLIPGVGFDVVPSDCLAARLVEALPAATHLSLAFEAGGGPSPGTAKTAAEGMGHGGCIRRDGKLQRVPPAWKTREIPFATGKRTAVTIPWGDVYTAWVSTGVPNVEVYMAMPPGRIKKMRRMRFLAPLMKWRSVQSFMRRSIEQKVKGPSAEKRAGTRSQLWGEAVSADGRRVSATMTAPNGYELTVIAGLAITRHVLENDVEGGYYTPSLLMGAEFAESLPGVSLEFLRNA